MIQREVQTLKYIDIFVLGSYLYYLVELCFNLCFSFSNFVIIFSPIKQLTALLLGGISFIIIYSIHREKFFDIISKGIVCGFLICLLEFIVGGIYLQFDIHIWKYAFLDYKGLISFSWTMLWSLLSTIVLYMCKRFKL